MKFTCAYLFMSALLGDVRTYFTTIEPKEKEFYKLAFA